MSRHAWLTPNVAPGDLVCRPVWLPFGIDYLEAFFGAFLLLCDESNWQEFGDQTPADVAQAFFLAHIASSSESEACFVSLYIGEVRLYAGSGVPSADWLPCDGRLLITTQFPLLFAVIGGAFGGDGINDYAVPDLRGRVSIGVGSGTGLTPRALADDGGEEKHVLTVAEIPAHHHATQYFGNPGSGGTAYGCSTATAGSRNTADTGGGGSHENMPPFVALNYAIYAGPESGL